MKDKRHSPLRRQLNEAFCSPDGSFSPTKFLAVWAQISVLSHMNVWFEKLLDKPDTLLIVLSFTGFCLYTSWNPFSFLTGTTGKLSSQVLASFHPADPATSSEAHKKLFNLELLFLKDAEVEIALDGGQARQQIFAKETAVRLEANEEIRVQFMEPNSATLHLNGTALPFPENVNGRFLLHIPATPPAQ